MQLSNCYEWTVDNNTHLLWYFSGVTTGVGSTVIGELYTFTDLGEEISGNIAVSHCT